MIGCLGLYLLLPFAAIMVLPVWGIVGLFIYFGYSRRNSQLGKGIVEVPELDPDAPPIDAAPMPGAPVPGSPEERS